MEGSRNSSVLKHRRTAARIAAAADRISYDSIAVILVLSVIFVSLSLADIYGFRSGRGRTIRYRSLDELKAVNPDTVAWITLKGTHIDGPVVQGKDNYEYLDLDFNRRYYAGGTLFLDHANEADFSDEFNIIHGHHMAGGYMFGDLHKYTEKRFFNKYGGGKLTVSDGSYRLRVIAAGTVDAYDGEAYDVGAGLKTHVKVIDRVSEVAMNGWHDSIGEKKLLMLSTCTGDMSDNRTVVFCLMTEEKQNGK